MLPLSGGPLVDAGNTSAAGGLTTDQRGGSYVRVFNGAVDIGAVEVETAPPSPPPRGAALAGGTADGAGAVLNQSGGSYFGAGALSFFPGFGGSVRTAAADVTGDGVPDYVGGAGPGGGPRVAVIDGATGCRVADF